MPCSEPSSDPPTETLGAAYNRKMARLSTANNESSGSEDEEFRPENSGESDEDEDDEDEEDEEDNEDDSSEGEVEVVGDKRKASSKKGKSAKATKIRRADVQSHRSFTVELITEPKKSK